MKITEREARMRIDMASNWKLASIKKDYTGMPVECTLYQESNMYLPSKVRMVFQEELNEETTA